MEKLKHSLGMILIGILEPIRALCLRCTEGHVHLIGGGKKGTMVRHSINPQK